MLETPFLKQKISLELKELSIKDMMFQSKNTRFYFFVIYLFLVSSCNQKTEENSKDENGILLHTIKFDNKTDLKKFIIETQVDSTEVQIKKGNLDIDAIKGATIWFKEKLFAPLQIEYTAVVLDKGDSNDRVSDLNCFFMAIDSQCASNILTCADSTRTGRFPDYHRLRTYYVGYGGHDNTTTRMRRYVGYTGERPVLEEHDIGFPEIIKPNVPIKIKIRVLNNNITYSHNDKIIFEMNDSLPYHEGWFAFRTVRNHMQIQDLKITKLIP